MTTLQPLLGHREGSELRRLSLKQPAIDSACADGEDSMGALFDDIAAIKYQDTVEATYRG